MSESHPTGETGETATRRAGAFDIRNFIGLLLGIYGVILVIAQFFDSEEQLAKADGLRVNLWTGLALLATAAVFFTWARLRPIVVPVEEPRQSQDEAPHSRR